MSALVNRCVRRFVCVALAFKTVEEVSAVGDLVVLGLTCATIYTVCNNRDEPPSPRLRSGHVQTAALSSPEESAPSTPRHTGQD